MARMVNLLAVHDILLLLGRRATMARVEGFRGSAHAEEHHTHGPHIHTGWVVGLLGDELGRHVGSGAHELVCHLERVHLGPGKVVAKP